MSTTKNTIDNSKRTTNYLLKARIALFRKQHPEITLTELQLFEIECYQEKLEVIDNNTKEGLMLSKLCQVLEYNLTNKTGFEKYKKKKALLAKLLKINQNSL